MSEPIEVNSVWQYLPTYHRDGRFQVIGQNAHGLWRCKEATRLAEERAYTTTQILDVASMPKLQPGQLWLTSSNEEREIVKPLVPYVPIHGYSSKNGGARWRFKCPNGTLDDISEDAIIAVWTLVVIPPDMGNGKDRCLLCGKPCKVFFNFVECITPSCANNKRPASGG